MSGIENRRSERKYARGVLEYYDEEWKIMTGKGRLLDLSVMGAQLESSQKLALNQVLYLRLRIDGEMPLDLMAKVVNARPKGPHIVYGVKFGNHSAEIVSRIYTLL